VISGLVINKIEVNSILEKLSGNKELETIPRLL